MERELITVKEAANILGLGITQTRKLLKFADDRQELDNGAFRSLYCKCRVCEVKREHDCEKCCRDKNKGKLRCWVCHDKHEPCNLTSGLCQKCHAEKIVKNYITCGSCKQCDYSPDRCACLIDALDKARKGELKLI